MPTSPNGSIHVEHVWKKFRADRTAPLFYDQMARLRRSMADRNKPGYRWVLKDINLDVEPGGSVGLIGINGSGKTTLLKILSQVTFQTAGICNVQGRIGALLSVTSGLHPDLSGRENVFLYGAVLGMGRDRIRERFDEIVEFAGLNEAIDRQVKFFSLGMQMRLGFSIAAYLEPDVLLVDEVLSVGDANFQTKCLQRINEIVRSGTTLLYVSHDLASVEASCAQTVWLADSVVQAAGPTNEVITLYRTAIEQNAAMVTSEDGEITVLKAEISAVDGGQVRSECDVEVVLTLNSPRANEALFYLGVSQGTAFPMFFVRHDGHFPAGDFEVRCRLRHIPLPKGRYSVWPAMAERGKGVITPLLPWQPVASFDVMGPDRLEPPEGVMVTSPIYVGSDWEIN